MKSKNYFMENNRFWLVSRSQNWRLCELSRITEKYIDFSKIKLFHRRDNIDISNKICIKIIFKKLFKKNFIKNLNIVLLRTQLFFQNSVAHSYFDIHFSAYNLLYVLGIKHLSLPLGMLKTTFQRNEFQKFPEHTRPHLPLLKYSCIHPRE